MKTTLADLEKRRRALAAYSDSQRALVAESLADVRLPFQPNTVTRNVKSHPFTALFGASGLLMATWMTRKVAKLSFGYWLGKKAINFARRRLTSNAEPPRRRRRFAWAV